MCAKGVVKLCMLQNHKKNGICSCQDDLYSFLWKVTLHKIQSSFYVNNPIEEISCAWCKHFEMHLMVTFIIVYLVIKFQDEIFITYHLKVMLKSKWLDLVSDINFMTLTILNLILFNVPWIYLRSSSNKNLIFMCVENQQFNVVLS